MLTTFLALTIFACNPDADDSAGLCDGVELPECPPECPEDGSTNCGAACEVEGDECGNNIGDNRICVDGTWECTEHAPLEPNECNWVCR